MSPNNAYIGAHTRSFLSLKCGLRGGVFDSLARVLAHERRSSPSGTVHDLALAQGATTERAISAGVAAECWYAACSLTDDIQDEEARYAGVNLAQRVNAQAMLICVAHMALDQLSASSIFYRAGVRMLQGQYHNLARLNWDVALYTSVCRAIGGEAFASYLSLVPLACDATAQELELWREYGMAFGTLLNVVTDIETIDERVCLLDPADRAQCLDDAAQEFEKWVAAVPAAKALSNHLQARVANIPVR
jgi:hypothetical protein